ISARCRSPPESWNGRCRARSRGSGTPTASSSSSARAARSRRGTTSWTASTSAISAPTVRSGSSETSASCTTSPAKRPRTTRQSRSVKRSASRPSTVKRSALTRAPGPARPSSDRAVTLLPDPDSPTIATHSPGWTASDTPRTASTPAFGKLTRRFVTATSGAAPPGPAGRTAAVVPVSVMPDLPSARRYGAAAGRAGVPGAREGCKGSLSLLSRVRRPAAYGGRSCVPALEAVAQHPPGRGEAHHGDRDRGGREHRLPPGHPHVVAGLGEHRPPLRRGRLRAHAEEAERRGGDDRLCEHDRGEHEHRAEHVRQHVPEHQRRAGQAEGDRLLDVPGPPYHEGLG